MLEVERLHALRELFQSEGWDHLTNMVNDRVERLRDEAMRYLASGDYEKSRELAAQAVGIQDFFKNLTSSEMTRLENRKEAKRPRDNDVHKDDEKTNGNPY